MAVGLMPLSRPAATALWRAAVTTALGICLTSTCLTAVLSFQSAQAAFCVIPGGVLRVLIYSGLMETLARKPTVRQVQPRSTLAHLLNFGDRHGVARKPCLGLCSFRQQIIVRQPLPPPAESEENVEILGRNAGILPSLSGTYLTFPKTATDSTDQCSIGFIR